MYFILNRAKLSKYGIYQKFYYLYRRYYDILTIYYSSRNKNVSCPVCNYSGIKYKSKRCPKCWSGSRHRLLALYINNKNDISSSHRILEIAPNIATSYIFDRSVYPKYVSIDLDSPLADIHMDIENLAIKDNLIDFIVCYHVLNEIKNDMKALSELYRILKFGGIAIIQVKLSSDPNADTIESDECELRSGLKNLERRKNFKNITLYGHPSNVRIYGKIDYLAKLKSAGFDVEVDDYVKSFSANDIIKFGLSTDEDLYVCKKQATNRMFGVLK